MSAQTKAELRSSLIVLSENFKDEDLSRLNGAVNALVGALAAKDARAIKNAIYKIIAAINIPARLEDRVEAKRDQARNVLVALRDALVSKGSVTGKEEAARPAARTEVLKALLAESISGSARLGPNQPALNTPSVTGTLLPSHRQVGTVEKKTPVMAEKAPEAQKQESNKVIAISDSYPASVVLNYQLQGFKTCRIGKGEGAKTIAENLTSNYPQHNYFVLLSEQEKYETAVDLFNMLEGENVVVGYSNGVTVTNIRSFLRLAQREGRVLITDHAIDKTAQDMARDGRLKIDVNVSNDKDAAGKTVDDIINEELSNSAY